MREWGHVLQCKVTACYMAQKESANQATSNCHPFASAMLHGSSGFVEVGHFARAPPAAKVRSASTNIGRPTAHECLNAWHTPSYHCMYAYVNCRARLLLESLAHICPGPGQGQRMNFLLESLAHILRRQDKGNRIRSPSKSKGDEQLHQLHWQIKLATLSVPRPQG